MTDSERPTAKRIAVIGGGVLGLTAAYRLAQLGHAVTLWEQAERLGGQAAAFPVGNGAYLEYFYHHLFMSDTAIVSLIEELGIGDALVWRESNTGFIAEGRIWPLTGATDLLRLGFIPMVDRIRIGLVTLYLQRITRAGRRWKRFERVTAWEWLRRAVGQTAFDRVWGVQLRAKFGPRAEEVAMVWFWNKVFLRTQSRPGLLASEQLGYIIGSFNVLIDRLADAGRELGVDIRPGTGVAELHEGKDPSSRFTVVGTDGRSDEQDIVLATIPSPFLLRLAPQLPEPYRSKLTSATYQGAVVTLLQMSHPLSSTYWLNIGDERLPFTGIIEHTNMIGAEHYGGSHFAYVGKYVDWDHPYVTMDDEALLREYIPKLQIVNPEFDESRIERFWVFRERAAQPLVGLNYSAGIPEHRTPVDGLYLANTAQIYPEDRGTNYSVDLGNRIADMINSDAIAGSSCGP
ncbi:MAG TPA: NAD(P)/FAD-dependent oxidoreductase [Thermomicrobiales bacterium]|nr:NAD(P)/FAD-dependent oxidoreductase [Thermomicrobiales bacterium]